jgi:hypothetical protein
METPTKPKKEMPRDLQKLRHHTSLNLSGYKAPKNLMTLMEKGWAPKI